LGLAGRGLFYMIVGACALWAAIYAGNNDISEPTITAALLHHPAGIALVTAIGVAFAANGIWLLYSAWHRPRRASTTPRRVSPWLGRMGAALLGLLFLGLALTVGALLSGLVRPGNLHAISHLAGKALAFGMAGRLAVGVAGLIVIGSALFQLRFGWRGESEAHLDLRSLGRVMRLLVLVLSRAGITARAMVIALVGLFLLLAAWQGNPQTARGPTQSLRVLEYHHFGPWLLGAIAVGLVAFGMYLLIAAWYRRFQGSSGPGRRSTTGSAPATRGIHDRSRQSGTMGR
jgi:hypothetical protein